MKWWKWVLISLSCSAVGFGAGGITAWSCKKPVIEKVTEYKTEWKVKIEKENCLGLWQCYNSPLMIDVLPRIGNKLTIKAYDTCKKKQVDYNIVDKPKRNIILIGAMFETNFKSGGVGGYLDYYRIFGPIGFGGGVYSVYNFVDKTPSIGLRAGVAINF